MFGVIEMTPACGRGVASPVLRSSAASPETMTGILASSTGCGGHQSYSVLRSKRPAGKNHRMCARSISALRLHGDYTESPLSEVSVLF